MLIPFLKKNVSYLAYFATILTGGTLLYSRCVLSLFSTRFGCALFHSICMGCKSVCMQAYVYVYVCVCYSCAYLSEWLCCCQYCALVCVCIKCVFVLLFHHRMTYQCIALLHWLEYGAVLCCVYTRVALLNMTFSHLPMHYTSMHGLQLVAVFEIHRKRHWKLYSLDLIKISNFPKVNFLRMKNWKVFDLDWLGRK